jgi:phosphoribosylcarboxyaminoimidazole (NCAIR) mutase
MVAAHTVLPVLGVPVQSAALQGLDSLLSIVQMPGGVPVQSKALNGLDSLLSIVQMPAGIPVATLAIGVAGATNAALLAASILANKYEPIRTALEQFRKEQTEGVLAQPLPARTPQT